METSVLWAKKKTDVITMMAISLISASPSTRAEYLDVEIGQADHEGDADQGDPEPVDLPAVLQELALRERREPSEQRHAEDRITDHQRVAGHQAEGLAEPVADIGVHAAGRPDLLGHLGVGDREDREHDRREREGTGSAAARSERHRERRGCRRTRRGGTQRKRMLVRPTAFPLSWLTSLRCVVTSTSPSSMATCLLLEIDPHLPGSRAGIGQY